MTRAMTMVAGGTALALAVSLVASQPRPTAGIRLTAQQFGATCDMRADDTAALRRLFAAMVSHATVVISGCVFSAPLEVPPGVVDVMIEGSPVGALYTGPCRGETIVSTARRETIVRCGEREGL